MRLFVAICFDEKTKNALYSAIEAAEKGSKGKFSAKENLHLTLVFIGETERVEEIKSTLEEIEFPDFDIAIEGIGTFEKGIFWAGIAENEELSAIQKMVKEKLEALGFVFEEREYVPHITLARKFAPAEDFCGAAVINALPKEPFAVGKISLMKSENIEGTLRYTEIYSKELC